MAQVRNVSNDKLHVPHVGRVLDPDELLEVADGDFVDRAWPTSTWKLVTSPAVGTDVSPDDAILWTSLTPETAEREPAVSPAVPPASADEPDQHDGQE